MVRERPLITQAILKSKQTLPLKTFDGHSPKMFAVLYDNKRTFDDKRVKADIKKTTKDSLFFGDLFRELLSGKSSYATYLNKDIVGKKRKDVVLPDKVSCLVKGLMPSDERYYYNEVVGSRLGNYLGVSTVYNIAYRNRKTMNWFEYDYDYIISVDYVPEGYNSTTLSYWGSTFDEGYTLEQCLADVDSKVLSRMNKYGEITLTTERVREFKKEFARQYLFKSLLCEDLDFEGKNLGILYNGAGDFCMAPCFDMELFFKGKRAHTYFRDVAKIDMAFMQEFMPEVLSEFITRCRHGIESGDIHKIMHDSIKVNHEFGTYEKLYQQWKNNIRVMDEIYNELISQPTM